MGLIGAMKKKLFLIAPIKPSTTQRSLWCVVGLIGAIRKFLLFLIFRIYLIKPIKPTTYQEMFATAVGLMGPLIFYKFMYVWASSFY